MSKDTFIFDLDGTLLDTLKDLASSTNFALRQCGMQEHSIDDIRQFVGNGVRKLIERAVPNGAENPQFEDVFESFRIHYLEHSLDTTCPYEGIPQLLTELKRQGCKMAVVSNKMMAATQELVAHFFPEIEVAIGENEQQGIKKKPAPDMVFEALKQLGVEKERAFYVGDSDVDLLTAMNAGIPCASVLWGFRDRTFLMQHGAHMFVERPEELLWIR